MNILVSTTSHWNPGDDFIREGIFNLLPEMKGQSIEYFERNPLVTGKELEERVDWCDLYIHAGSPDWLLVHDEEYRLLQDKGKPYAFVGVGSSQDNPLEDCIPWLKEILGHPLCLLAIVRDLRASEALKANGIKHEHLICPAYYVISPEAEPITPPSDPWVILNPNGHVSEKDPRSKSMRLLYSRLLKELKEANIPARMICHNRRDQKWASDFFETEVFFSTRWQDYLPIYQGSRLYVGDRVHGAICAASAGKHAYFFGYDVRRWTCEPLPQIEVWERFNACKFRLSEALEKNTGQDPHKHKRACYGAMRKALEPLIIRLTETK